MIKKRPKNAIDEVKGRKKETFHLVRVGDEEEEEILFFPHRQIYREKIKI